MDGVTRPRDVVCNGCGGVGGRHVDLRCPFFVDRAGKVVRQERPGGKRRDRVR